MNWKVFNLLEVHLLVICYFVISIGVVDKVIYDVKEKTDVIRCWSGGRIRPPSWRQLFPGDKGASPPFFPTASTSRHLLCDRNPHRDEKMSGPSDTSLCLEEDGSIELGESIESLSFHQALNVFLVTTRHERLRVYDPHSSLKLSDVHLHGMYQTLIYPYPP